MALVDWIFVNHEAKAGGQGSVQKVRHGIDGRVGALKRLHDEVSNRTGGRYRFLTEVAGLRAMNGNGVPRVLEANEDQWKGEGAELYLVMEFIEGPTMTELVQKAPPGLDDAVGSVCKILETLSAGHKLPLHHRDLKPDNVILRSGRWNEPVLVDLGIAWHPRDERADFQTPKGIELGNRFLRLPEFAPGGKHRDARSDLALAAGLLFFMISGSAPRVLIDYDGLQPQEREPSVIGREVLEDERWMKLKNIFRVAFQHRLEARFSTAEEFASRLVAMSEKPAEPFDNLETELAKLREITDSAVVRERTEAAPSIDQANKKLCAELSRIWSSAGLQWGGQNPVFKNGGATNEFYCVVSRQGQEGPSVVFRHKIELSDGRVNVSWVIEDVIPTMEYKGPAGDADGLAASVLSKARILAAEVIRRLNVKLEPQANLARFFQE